MLKKIALIYLGVQFVSVSALGSIVLAETSTTPSREGGFCVGIAEKFQKIDQKVLEQSEGLLKEGRDRLPRLEERWQKHIADLEGKRTKRDANLDHHFAKLEERAKTEAQKQAVVAFKTAVLNAIDARRTAVKVALDAFHSGVKSALEARKTAVEKAFADRAAAFRAAVEKAKGGCLVGLVPMPGPQGELPSLKIDQRAVRTAFTSSLKSAQEQFAAARRANEDFKKAFEKLKADKKAAFEKAHKDFKTAIETAKVELKKAFGESNATSTTRTESRPVETGRDINISGRVWSKSDVQTIPDSPIRAAVLLMTKAAHDSILTRATLTESEFDRFVAGYSFSDSAGRYSVHVAPGDLWLCLARLGETDAHIRFPVLVAGCVPVTVSATQPVQKDIFVGEGGVTTGP